ncbi:hypothetical protein ACSBR2_029042 [Camellia fascicularis]
MFSSNTRIELMQDSAVRAVLGLKVLKFKKERKKGGEGDRGQGFLAARRDLDLERRASYGDGKTIVEEWSFNLENALESHTKAKHSAGK